MKQMLDMVWARHAGSLIPVRATIDSIGNPEGETNPVPEITSADKTAALTYLTAADGACIPLRVFAGKEGLAPVVMLHGLQSHAGWFTQSARCLADLGHPVYAPDRRGSGLSREQRGHARNGRALVDEVATVVEYAARQCNTRQVHLLGHCFGAVPATLFAGTRPQLVQSLILATPALGTGSDLTPLQKAKVLLSNILGWVSYVPVPLRTEQFSDLPEYQEFIRWEPLALWEMSSSLCMAIFRARKLLDQRVAGLTMPVFMALADKDAICDNQANRMFFEKIPSDHKKLISYAHAVHILEFSRARDVFIADLTGWMAEVG